MMPMGVFVSTACNIHKVLYELHTNTLHHNINNNN
jgi:hypothetical protein